MLAGDGRPLTAEFLAAAAEGLRFGGCDVIEATAATTGSLAFAMHRAGANGGLLLGNPADRPHVLGLKFWNRGPIPWSAGPQLERLRAGLDRPLARSSRTSGSTSRLTIDRDYLDSLAEYFHALRPLRIVLRTTSSALRAQLARLAANLACTILDDALEPACRAEPHDRPPTLSRPQLDLRALSSTVVASSAHFGLWVDGDGEAMRLVDERGREVSGDRLLLVLARHLLTERPAAAIAVESDCCREVIVALHAAGAAVHRSTARRAEMSATMSECQAIIGGGPSGRIWSPAPSPAPDALHALALLLRILSERDWPLSEVVARSLEPPAVAS